MHHFLGGRGGVAGPESMRKKGGVCVGGGLPHALLRWYDTIVVPWQGTSVVQSCIAYFTSHHAMAGPDRLQHNTCNR